MGRPPRIPGERAWLNQVFDAAAANGGVVRRSVEDVERLASLEMLKEQVKERGFHLIRTGDQYVVLCHDGDLTVIC